MKKLFVAIGLTLLAAISTNAQQRFVSVGQDSARRPIVLDTTSISGTRFNLVSRYRDGFAIEQYQVNCQEQVYVLTGVARYDANQNLISKNEEVSDVFAYNQQSPIGRASAIVCGNR